MSESKALTRSEPSKQMVFSPGTLPELMKISEMIAKSGLCPQAYQRKPDDVASAIMMGAEIGLLPMQALQNIAIVNGRPSVWGDAALAIVRGHHDCVDVVESYDAATCTATCTVKRKGCEPCVRTFSHEDAKTAKLWGKQGPWTLYPKRMLQMRARGYAIRDSFPDALRGIITTEESQDTPPASGPVVESTVPLADAIESRDIVADAEYVESEAEVETQGTTPLEEIQSCESRDRLREIYKATTDEALKTACIKRGEHLKELAQKVKDEVAGG